MRRLIAPLVLILMALLLAGAVWLDCNRMAGNYQRRVNLADEEMKKHEERLMAVLRSERTVSPEVRAALDQYASVSNSPVDMPPRGREAPYHDRATRKGRIDAYDAVLANYRKTMSATVDPTNPLERKFMDNVAGAMNRRDVAEKQYDEEWRAQQQFLDSWQGRVATMF